MALVLKDVCSSGTSLDLIALRKTCLTLTEIGKVKRHKSSIGTTLFIFSDGSVLEFYKNSVERGVKIYPIPEIRKQYGQPEPVM